jgi:uncharacterized membrane protein
MNMLIGIISLLFGLIIVLTHSIWLGWPIIITVVGYLAVLKGVVRLCFTNSVVNMIHQFRSIKIYYFVSMICLVFGIALMYLGYHHKM